MAAGLLGARLLIAGGVGSATGAAPPVTHHSPASTSTTADGNTTPPITVTTTSNHNNASGATRYDLTIDTDHTYYVLAGNTPVLVHNTGCGPTARFEVDSNGVATDLQPLGRSSTGRTSPNNLTEQMAMHEAMSSPASGNLVPLRKGMTDLRWPGLDGWVKMSRNVNGVEIHVRNAVTGQVDDFKFPR